MHSFFRALSCVVFVLSLNLQSEAASPAPIETRIGRCHFPVAGSPGEDCPGVSFGNDGNPYNLSCPPGQQIDPKSIWSEFRTRGGIEQRIRDEFDKHKDLDKLALWFVCQGFYGGYGLERAISRVNRTTVYYIHATRRNDNGLFDEYYINKFTPMNAKALYINFKFEKDFSVREVFINFPSQFTK